jgi:hypothetical protein
LRPIEGRLGGFLSPSVVRVEPSRGNQGAQPTFASGDTADDDLSLKGALRQLGEPATEEATDLKPQSHRE